MDRVYAVGGYVFGALALASLTLLVVVLAPSPVQADTDCTSYCQGQCATVCSDPKSKTCQDCMQSCTANCTAFALPSKCQGSGSCVGSPCFTSLFCTGACNATLICDEWCTCKNTNPLGQNCECVRK